MISNMSSQGGMPAFHSRKYLEKHGYETITDHGYKTPLSMARDTEHTNYEYVVSTTGHIVYIRHGKIYDSFESDRKRIF